MEPSRPIDHLHELELASELLEATGPMDVDRTVRRVFARTGVAVGGRPAPQAAAALAGLLHDAAQQTLPNLGVPTPHLAEQAGSLLGLELEGLSPPDQELEAARQLVRLASHAYAGLATGPGGPSAEHAARTALGGAAAHYAPGVLTQIARSTGRAPS